MNRRKGRRVLVRAFDLILSFDSDKQDCELEEEIYRLSDEINKLLQKSFSKELPQIDFDLNKQKKKIKIGIRQLDSEIME
jgi:hypothetical protein